MTLQPGQSLAHYRLVEEIGKGGMGVVWKAHDGKLDRDVAVKILPAEFSQDKQRLGRFEREAKLLAALNHPNIASIHGLEETDGTHFLVLELVPGQSLAEALKGGPLPVEEAFDVCRQVAEGLEAAHDAGVIHRDLKPGNVRVTPDGKAKVLDFGLAKELGGEGAGSTSGGSATDLSHSPTVAAGTQAGVILGTAPYMSPEQARGKKLDKRTDIWSFGCLLYECLTGRMAFTGETVPDIFSAILQGDPDWSALPDRTPPRVRELLERCLEKSPRSRLHDIGDARIELEKAVSGREWTTSGAQAAALPARRSFRRTAAWLAASFLMGAAVASGVWISVLSTGSAQPFMRFSIETPPGRWVTWPFLAPDGMTLAYRGWEKNAEGATVTGRLYLRRLDQYRQIPVEGSEDLTNTGFSPDGKWLAMIVPVAPGSSSRRLVKVPADGSAAALRIADLQDNVGQSLWNVGRSLVWLADDRIVLGTTKPWSLVAYPADGSAPGEPVPLHGASPDSDFVLLRALPDDRTLLATGWFFVEPRGRWEILAVDVETGESRSLIEDSWRAAWSSTGHLLFTRGGSLLGVPFDPERLETTGGPVTIIDGLWANKIWHHGVFDLSASGSLAYLPGGIAGTRRRLALMDRDGRIEPWSEDERSFVGAVAVSRDGRRLAVTVNDLETQKWEIWASEVERPRLRRLAVEPGSDCDKPVWSPDGQQVAYRCVGTGDSGGVYIRRYDMTDEPVQLIARRSADEWLTATSFSPDGTTLLVSHTLGDEGSILVVPTEAGSDGQRTPTLVSIDQSNPYNGRHSPDGRLLAYDSDETGRDEVYVRRFLPDGSLGPATRISTEGGFYPFWRKGARGEGLEVIYRFRGFEFAVSISEEPALAVSEPRQVIDFLGQELASAVPMPDGRFLVVEFGENEAPSKKRPSRHNVILNFHEEIRRKLAEAE
jgi:Tol biopolymer transport system component